MARVWIERHGKLVRFRNRQTRCWCSKRMKGRPNVGTGCKWNDPTGRRDRKRAKATMHSNGGEP